MANNLTKRKRQTLRYALILAIEDRKALCDCYKVEWAKRNDENGHPFKVVPEADRPYIAKVKREIQRFRQLLAELQD